jgi:aspartyl-tRNA synthetase
VEADGSVKSSVDKFYGQEQLQQQWKAAFNAQPGDCCWCWPASR